MSKIAVGLMEKLRQAGTDGVSFGELYALLMTSPDRTAWFGGEEKALNYLDSLLQEMREAGMARIVGGADLPHDRRWALDADWFWRGPGRVDPPPPDLPGANRNDNDGEGGGLREVLGHSLLFSLPADEFDAAIARSLGGM
jgi:hypothetical protein